MKKRITFLIHTEYHLLLTINQILEVYKDSNAFQITIIIRRKPNSKRLRDELNLSILNTEIIYWDFPIDLKGYLTTDIRNKIDLILNSTPDTFIFFQEQDPLAMILVGYFSKKSTEVYLFQDGLKPYTHLKYLSIGLIRHNISQIRWLQKNGYRVPDYFSFLICKKYGHIKGIKKLFLTFPESYKNWNNRPVEKIIINTNSDLSVSLKTVFRWEHSILPEKSNIILYLNQPMHDEGLFEITLLKKIQINNPNKNLYIKLHPLTDISHIELFETIPRTVIIKSNIPAELFIMHLKESLIISLASTSMFINNPNCKFFWLYKLATTEIYRLKRYSIFNPTSHIKEVDSIDQIFFNPS